jgi:hypothetical protein
MVVLTLFGDGVSDVAEMLSCRAPLDPTLFGSYYVVMNVMQMVAALGFNFTGSQLHDLLPTCHKTNPNIK